MHVSGTKGYVEWKDFVLPYYGNNLSFDIGQHEFEVDACRFNMKQNLQTVSVPEYSNNMPDAQETKLFRNFSSLVLGGTVDSQWPEMSLKTQRVLDAALESARNDSQPVYF